MAKGKSPKTEQPVAVEPQEQAPNVIWRGEKEPPQTVRIGMLTLAFPDAETQRKGFYAAENARRIVLQIPGYKFLKPLG